MSSSENFVTPESMFSYVQLWRAKPYEEGDDPKFTVALVFSKNQDLSIITNAYNKVLNADFEGVLPYGAKAGGLVDGAVRYPGDPFYADKLILQCSQSEERPPQVVDANNNPIMDKSELYSGVIGHAFISFYGYQGGSKGIGTSIHGVMKMRDGEHMGGGSVDARAGFAGMGGAAPAPAANTGGAAPAPTQPVMTDKATSTHEAYVKAGWSDEQLIAEGLMLAPAAATTAPPPNTVDAPPKPPVTPPAHTMTALATATYEGYKDAGWTDEQLIKEGLMNP